MITARNISEKIYWLYNGDYRLCNIYIFGWESDFFMISKSGYSIEIEIKISRSDFKADTKKTHIFTGDPKHDHLLSDKTNKPNKYYYACPEGLIKPNEIHQKYGLIYIQEINSYSDYKSYSVRVIKEAQFLHKVKHLNDPKFVLNLMKKYHFRYVDLRNYLKLYEYDLKFGQQRLEHI